ncbi:hypothetical protein [Listeria booriae]|uniref:hypothetical protein n=1 Tax=Listeria booriae TaxID=1552123 RepID=UPI0016257F0C|nr:hypothetical protein [Listeria booriae]MBC2196839.1 hypothetical protein [Listeria booriae]
MAKRYRTHRKLVYFTILCENEQFPMSLIVRTKKATLGSDDLMQIQERMAESVIKNEDIDKKDVLVRILSLCSL